MRNYAGLYSTNFVEVEKSAFTAISYVIVTVLIFATALISQYPAMRRANRLNLAKATKVMT